MKCFLFFNLLLIITSLTQAQNIKIIFDFSNATSTLNLIQKSSLTEEEFAEFLSLQGTKALLQKINSYPDTARTALTRAILNLPSTQQGQNFGYRRIKREKDSLQAFITTFEKQKSFIEEKLTKSLLPYLPKNKTMSITVYGTLGGYSSAYTLGDDSTFYLGLQFFKGDLNGVFELCKHELFHNIQTSLYNNKIIKQRLQVKDKGLANAYEMLCYLFKEGTAEYVADLNKADHTSPYIKELWEHMRVNESRLGDAFYLFERILLDMSNNFDSISYNKTYNILFSWEWNNPAYYIGYVMTKSLVAENGESILKKYLAGDPTVFVLDYIKLTKSKDDQLDHRFSVLFEQLVRKINGEIETISY